MFVCYILSMKNKTVMMRIPIETHAELKKIKEVTEHSLIWIIKRAVNNYLKAKKLTPWDKLSKVKQNKLKNKVKALVK